MLMSSALYHNLKSIFLALSEILENNLYLLVLRKIASKNKMTHRDGIQWQPMRYEYGRYTAK